MTAKGDEERSRLSQASDLVTAVALMPAVSHAVHTLVLLDIPDRLGDGAASVQELASHVSAARTRPLRQLLRAAATTGLFRSLPDDRFALTEDGRRLMRDHPSSARDLVLIHLSSAFQGSYGSLPAAVRSGRTAFEIEHGTSFFEHLARDEAASTSFNRMMGAYLGESPLAVARSSDLADARTIVDVGGGIGTQLEAMLELVPEAHGVLFDTPAVIADAERLGLSERLRGRCILQEGNFFDEVPAGADVYVLSHIIHDWDDDDAIRILLRCAEACASGSRVLIVEELIPDGDGPEPVKMLDVALLSGFGGGERTIAEFDALLAAAGLRRIRTIDTGTTVTIIDAAMAGADR